MLGLSDLRKQFFGFFAMLMAGSGSAQELAPWADQGLKVRQGLLIWLDAGRLNAARQAHGEAELSSGSRVQTWYDSSGRNQHFGQDEELARPRFLDGGIRFDGESTYLARSGLNVHLKDFTLFIVGTPLSNGGGFRAFTAYQQDGQLDYTSGITLDMGPGLSGRFETLNVEGKGFNGAENLLEAPSKFGDLRQITVTSTSAPGGTKLYLDGKVAHSRDRAESLMDVDRMFVGARYYGSPASIRGFLDGDVLHVLLYGRVLDASEREEVERYLAKRLAEFGSLTRPRRAIVGNPLVSVPNPPAVQMLVRGFQAHELPVDLTNINNLRYRHDGKLVALAYDGNIDLLSDRDGDGLEETVERFWENTGSLVAPIGMALTPPEYPRGDGVFVASKGKVSLISDTNRDGKADEEIVIAKGWKELPHGVDALGVALGADGSVYFGLGTTDFTNAYMVNQQGQAGYRLEDEHGTIQRIAPDFSSREIIATGIRFPVGLAFNRLGDLFATDQEGATWLSNGNPFDELLHIQKKRHYGFPPRHPTHLPAVIDEPSVFDYAPQHQSTCGLAFNEPVNFGPIFGPDHWASNALVAGYSRGKLYRTQLAKTEAGYVAKTQLLAVMNMLAADVCVSPRGDLVVAVHSGQPDWGSGPKGNGKLYQIRYANKETPQPVLVYASSPQEVRVDYDRPIDPTQWRELAARATIEYGRAVSPADRYESLRPGYEVVGRQQAAPRFQLPILSAHITSDLRSLLLTTAPHPEASSYTLTLPASLREAPELQSAPLKQGHEVDLGYDLSGVEAVWAPLSGEAGWTGWLPHPSLAVSRALTIGSAHHDQLWEFLSKPGRLTLKTRLNLWHMLRPGAQPGSDPGYVLPQEHVTLALQITRLVKINSSAPFSAKNSGGTHHVALQVTPKEGEWLPLAISLETGDSTALDLTWFTQEDPRPRALPLKRILLPWANLERSDDEFATRVIPELVGGDWARGRALFHGAQARCSSCHKLGGRGGEVGPDLSNLIHRDYASVYRDIHTPSAAINPDYVTHSVALTDGRVLQGALRTREDSLVIGDTEGRQTTVARADVESISPSSISTMPEGLDVALGSDNLRDLLTFLLTEPLSPAKLEHEGAPLPRRRAELNAVLEGSASPENPDKLHVVLASGPKDHGPGEHNYPLWMSRWSTLLATDPTLLVETAEGWPTSEQWQRAGVVFMYSNNPGWEASKAAELDRYLARGGGLVIIHYAVDGHGAVDAFADRIGLAWHGGKSAFRHGALEIDFTASKHPITRGFGKLRLEDESYWNLVGDPGRVEILGTGKEDGVQHPLFWTRQHGPGRVFVSIPGHFTWTFDDPLFRILLLRGMAWTANQPVDRFNDLATPGARLTE